MSLTQEDRRFLVKLALIMMNHFAWLAIYGSKALDIWTEEKSAVRQSWKEKTQALLKGKL